MEGSIPQHNINLINLNIWSAKQWHSQKLSRIGLCTQSNDILYTERYCNLYVNQKIKSFVSLGFSKRNNFKGFIISLTKIKLK